MKGKKNQKNNAILNEQIRSKEVRLISETGEQLGIIATSEALSRAQDVNLDLVLVSPNGDIPVAKIIDYGKFKYEQQKKLKEAKSKQVKVSIKEIRVSPTIDNHDYETKINNAKKFLSKGDKVQFTLRFRGRMITHQEFGREIMKRVIVDLGDSVNVDVAPKMDGRRMFLIVSPVKK